MSTGHDYDPGCDCHRCKRERDDQARPKAEEYDIRVGYLAARFRDQNVEGMLRGIRLHLPLMAGAYARAAAHWAHVLERHESSACGFEVVS